MSVCTSIAEINNNNNKIISIFLSLPHRKQTHVTQIINTLQYSKCIEGQPTTRVGSPKKLKLNLLNYKT